MPGAGTQGRRPANKKGELVGKVKLPRQWKFGSIPEEILLSELSVYAKVTIGAITYHAFDDGPSYPGINRLAKLSSVNRKSILRAIDELENAGFLKVDRVDGKSNSYEFLSKTSPWEGLVDPKPVLLKPLTSPSRASKVPKPVPPTDSNETKLNETKTNELNLPPLAGKEVTPHRKLTLFWTETMISETKEPGPFDGREAKGLSNLLKITTPENVEKVISWAIKIGRKDKYVQAKCDRLYKFYENWNILLDRALAEKVVPIAGSKYKSEAVGGP